MLNEHDIDLMAEWQDEIYYLRARPVEFVYIEEQRDPITGVVIGDGEVARQTEAVITELASNNERYFADGIEYKQGDIKVDVKIDAIEDIVDKVERIKYDGKIYEILGVSKKGIGKRNRIEFLGREIA